MLKLDSTYVLLGAILLAALALRLLPLTFCMSGGSINFSEFDPYYHMRRIVYTVAHFPLDNAFDSYVNYPYGYGISWPPLFDILAAGLSLIAGLGSPSRPVIEMVSASLPVLLGLASVVLVYFIVKEALGKSAGLLAAFFMAILPAAVFRTAFAYTDHHALEVAMSLTLYLLFMRAVASAREEKLSLSNLARKPLVYGLLAGIATAGMVFSWDGAPIFIAIIALYGLVQYAYDAYCGRDTEYLTLTGALTSLVAVAATVPFILLTPAGQSFTLSAMYLSWFQVAYLLGIAAFFLAMGGLTRLYSGLKAPWFSTVLTAVVGLGLIVVISYVALPPFFHALEEGVNYLMGTSDIMVTIVEVEPLFINDGALSAAIPWAYLSMGGVLAVIGAAVFLFTRKWNSLKEAEVFIIVWTLIVLVLGLMQKRFIYLLAVNVSVFAGFAVKYALEVAGFFRVADTKNKKVSRSRDAFLTPPIVAVFMVTGILAIPILMATYTVSATPEFYSADWNKACEWVDANTPKTSYAYSADNGTHPEYGIMSWWDYGNFILYKAERPAVANNFQTGVKDAANFFIAQDEATANAIMDERSAKYVMLDYRLGSPWAGVSSGIFENMPYLAGDSVSSYHMTYVMPAAYGSNQVYDGSDKYYSSMYSRMFNQDGLGGRNELGYDSNGLEHYRLIYATSGSDPVKVFEYVKGAVISGTATPGARVRLSLNVTTPDGEKAYVSSMISGADGAYSFTVPYPTSSTVGVVSTGSAYTITSGTSSAQVQVSADAASNGGAVAGGKL